MCMRSLIYTSFEDYPSSLLNDSFLRKVYSIGKNLHKPSLPLSQSPMRLYDVPTGKIQISLKSRRIPSYLLLFGKGFPIYF